MPRPRGRRPASDGDSGSAAQEAIRAAAKQQFATLGYPGTTLRGIAREAGVDARLVTHYFGSKQQLFMTVTDLPFDPERIFAIVLEPGREDVGRRVAQFAVGILDTPAGQQTMTGLLRAAASEEEAAAMLRALLIDRLIGPLTRQMGGDHAELRASLVGSLMAGLVMARHVIGLQPLVDAPVPVLVDAIAPAIEHYLTGDLGG